MPRWCCFPTAAKLLVDLDGPVGPIQQNLPVFSLSRTNFQHVLGMISLVSQRPGQTDWQLVIDEEGQAAELISTG